MSRWAPVVLLAAGAVAVAAIYGVVDGLVTVAILAPLGAVTLLAVRALLHRRARVGGLRRQFALLGAIAAAQLVAGVALFSALMFVSTHDALLTALLAAYAAAIAWWAAQRVGQRALADVDAIRATLAAVGDGRRDVRTDVTGRDEVARLAADVDLMIGRLANEEEARGRLIAAVSHDLRTPITALRLLSDAIEDGVGDAATRREYAARMSTHVRALGALIDDLFELTRLQSGELRWTTERVPLDALVRETVEAMRPAADAGAVAVRVELDGAAPPARGNPERLQRVLFNLIQNAIRHTPADGSVTVRARPSGEAVEVEVADTGIGIAPDERDRVFEPFFRGGHGAARTDGGAGLGLAISRAIVEAHGGRIWLADAPVGTRVRIWLPADASRPAGAVR